MQAAGPQNMRSWRCIVVLLQAIMTFVALVIWAKNKDNPCQCPCSAAVCNTLEADACKSIPGCFNNATKDYNSGVYTFCDETQKRLHGGRCDSPSVLVLLNNCIMFVVNVAISLAAWYAVRFPERMRR